MSKTTQSTHKSRMQNEFGADLWIRDPNNHRRPTAGRGLFAGLQDVKHYNVERGWAKREPDARQGFFASVLNSSRAEHESWWRSMRAMVMRAATESIGKIHSGLPMLEPIPSYISTSTSPRSPMEALAIRVRQSAQQRRTMASMASPSPSPFPFIPPHHREHEPSYPRRRPPRIVMSHLKLPRVTALLTKSIPLTGFSLALVAAIASSAVAIALPSCEASSSTSPSSSAAPNDSDYNPPAHHRKTIIPLPHQIYDEAMYSYPKLEKPMDNRLEHPHGLRHLGNLFIRDAGEERRELRERYGYTFWVNGMCGLDG